MDVAMSFAIEAGTGSGGGEAGPNSDQDSEARIRPTGIDPDNNHGTPNVTTGRPSNLQL